MPPAPSLAARALRGGLVTASGTWVRFLLQFGTVVVVARVLGPSEYGAAAVVLIATSAAELLRASGVVSVVTQDRTLTGPVISSLHLVNALVGTLLGLVTVVLMLSVPMPARSLDGHGAALGLVFVGAGLSGVPAAMLARELRFRILAGAEMLAMATGCVTALVIVASGGGAMALVWQAVVFAAVLTITVTACGDWRPSRPAPWRETTQVIRRAIDAVTVQALNFASRNSDRVVIGTWLGSTAVGLWAQAMQLLTLPLEQTLGPAGRVAVPAMSRVRHERARTVAWYRSAVGIAALALWPVFTVGAVLATPLITVLFGPEWAGAAPLFQLLVVAGITQTIGYVSVWLFVSAGRFGDQRRWALITRPIVLISFFAGLPWGLHGMAIAYVCAEALIVIPGFVVASRGTDIRLRDLVASVTAPAVVAITSGAAAWGVSTLTQDSHLAALALGGSAGALALALSALLLPTTRRLLSGVASKVRLRVA